MIACAPDARVVHLRLEPSEALGCRPDELTSLRIEPLGDFPTGVRPNLAIDVRGGARAIERFPDGTIGVALRAEGFVRRGESRVPWIGGGVARLVEGEVPVPILQLRRACALGDPQARVPAGAVVLALDDGRLFLAGGHEPDGRVLATVVTVRPGQRLAQSGLLRLFSPRTGATGTALPGGLVLIAGGTSAVGGAPFDSAELLRVTAGHEERLEGAFLQRARRGHGAAWLGEGRVLLVGGVDASGRPHTDAELVTVLEEGAVVQTELLSGVIPRTSATVLPLDDGTVVVVGGLDEAGRAVGTVERFDPASGAFEVTSASFPGRINAAYAALPGRRVVQLGGREGDGSWSPRAAVLLEGGARRVELPDALVSLDASGAESPPAIEAPVATGLPDGRVLVIGRDPRDGRAVARVIDPGGTRTAQEAEREPIDPSRVATHLVPLADGSIVEADPNGASLLRLDVSTEFTDPAARIFPGQPNQRDEVSLDAPGSWTADGGELVARRDGARLDIPTSRFAEVRIELEVRGSAELLLAPPGRAPVVVAIDDDRVSLGECGADADGVVIVERLADRVVIGRGEARVECPVTLEGRVGLALRAFREAAVRQIAIERR